MIRNTGTLREFFENVYKPLRLMGRSPGTEKQYQSVLRHWERFTHDLPLAEADDIAVASVMGALLKRGDSPASANRVLRHLKAIFRFANERKILSELPSVQKVPEPKRAPRAWLIEEVEAILATAQQSPGMILAVPACRFWPSLVLAIYDSGGRVGAITETTPHDLCLRTGMLRLSAEHQKDKEEQLLKLHPQTIQAIQDMGPLNRPRIWHCQWTAETLTRKFRVIVEASGVEVGHGPNSLFHRLRRTNASYTKAAGGDPQRQLGHSTPQVTNRYLDPRICGASCAADLIPRPKFMHPRPLE